MAGCAQAEAPLSLSNFGQRSRSLLDLHRAKTRANEQGPMLYQKTLAGTLSSGRPVLTDQEQVQQWVVAARNGDHQAFSQLVRRYESQVAATTIGMLGDCDEAEDIGQETFIRFYKSLARFRGDSDVGTYITRIVINLSLNELKKRKRKRGIFSRTPPDEMLDLPDQDQPDLFNEDKEIVHRALKKLDPKYRAVLVLRLMDGYSTAETSEILGIPLGTVLSRLSRAQKKLNELLTPYYSEER